MDAKSKILANVCSRTGIDAETAIKVIDVFVDELCESVVRCENANSLKKAFCTLAED